uniref:helix-turn-helix domain-containing protein n=1 Tax=Sphingomonas populi TaxID=2484750 RepID=UPI0013EEC045
MLRWRLVDLAQWLWDEFALSVTRDTLGRELRAIVYRKLSARPRHRARNLTTLAILKSLLRPSCASECGSERVGSLVKGVLQARRDGTGHTFLMASFSHA